MTENSKDAEIGGWMRRRTEIDSKIHAANARINEFASPLDDLSTEVSRHYARDPRTIRRLCKELDWSQLVQIVDELFELSNEKEKLERQLQAAGIPLR